MDYKEDLFIQQIGRSSQRVNRNFIHDISGINKIINTGISDAIVDENLLHMKNKYKHHAVDCGTICSTRDEQYGMISGQVIRRSHDNITEAVASISDLPSPRRLMKRKRPYKDVEKCPLKPEVINHVRDLQMKKVKFFSCMNADIVEDNHTSPVNSSAQAVSAGETAATIVGTESSICKTCNELAISSSIHVPEENFWLKESFFMNSAHDILREEMDNRPSHNFFGMPYEE